MTPQELEEIRQYLDGPRLDWMISQHYTVALLAHVADLQQRLDAVRAVMQFRYPGSNEMIMFAVSVTDAALGATCKHGSRVAHRSEDMPKSWCTGALGSASPEPQN